MEYIKKEELIIGEIYKADNGSLTYIMKVTKDLENVKNIPEYCDFMKHGCFNGSNLTFTNATPEEKHWLNTCIEQYKFVEYEEAMKTFIPEYVECIKTVTGITIGKILSVENNIIIDGTFNNYSIKATDIYKYFKPSTKEAYDAQFVVKEPLPQFKVIETIETITKVENNEGSQFFIGDNIIKSTGKIPHKIKSFKYNNDKTNILALTNYNNSGISIDKIEHYIKPKNEK